MVLRLSDDPAVQRRHGDDGRSGFGDADRNRLPRRFRSLPARGPLALPFGGLPWTCRRGPARARNSLTPIDFALGGSRGLGLSAGAIAPARRRKLNGRPARNSTGTLPSSASSCWSMPSPITPSTCSSPTGHIATWNAGRAPRSRAMRPRRSSAGISRTFFTEEDKAAGASRAHPAHRRRGGAVRVGGLAGPQGRHPFLGAWSWSIRSATRTASCSASPRSPATSPTRSAPQEELEEARNALFQSQKLQALGELTGGIAHDFNNLITVVRGSAEMLKRSDLSEAKRDRYLDAIIETAERAAALTSHLLAFGRRQALKPQVIDINVRLDALARRARPDARQPYRGQARSRPRICGGSRSIRRSSNRRCSTPRSTPATPCPTAAR